MQLELPNTCRRLRIDHHFVQGFWGVQHPLHGKPVLVDRLSQLGLLCLYLLQDHLFGRWKLGAFDPLVGFEVEFLGFCGEGGFDFMRGGEFGEGLVHHLVEKFLLFLVVGVIETLGH